MFSPETISRDSTTNRFYLTSNSFINPKHVPADVGDQKNQNQHGLARHRSAPSSFLQHFLDTISENDIEDNSSSGEDDLEEALLFSALLNDPNHDPNLSTQAHVKESRSGYANDYFSAILRQNSSPATFFRGYAIHNHEEAESTGISSNNTSFSSGLCSSTSFMPSAPANRNESMDKRSLINNRTKKRKHEESEGMDSPGLIHHLGSSRTRANMSDEENLIQFHQETTVTTCQLRAKRGCATHPRSIAERNRRTRITRNMKKLQDICPNMNKQTSTADMLELAVEYIKDLQNQVQILSDMDAKCACPSKRHQHNTIA